jgi:hypothetical protein
VANLLARTSCPIANATGTTGDGRSTASGKGDHVMAAHVPSHGSRIARGASQGRAAQLVGRSLLATLACAGGMLPGAPVEAARLCGERGALLKSLEQKHQETRQALGLSADGGVLEVLVSPSGGWTILVTYPKRPTCVVAVGEAWQALQLTGDEGA